MKIYLDCGFYAGMAMKRYLEEKTIDKGWKIYAFEPNPDVGAVKKIEDFYPDLGIDLIEKAVWTEDGEVKFHIAGREDSGSIAGTSGHTEPKEITVPSIDFSKFVAELPDTYIICSMDIEGAEFKVLEKMLKDKTIDKINELDIEFHHRLTLDYEPQDAKDLISKITERGVRVRLKDRLE